MKKTAIVTGASGESGGAIAERLAADGFSVVVHHFGSSTKADEAVGEITKNGGKAVSIYADISKPEDVKELFLKSKTAFGDIHSVVNTAGVVPIEQIAKGDIDAFDRVIATNLRGSYLMMSEAANHVVDGGRIVLFSSCVVAANFLAYGAYIASKEAVGALTRVLADELGPRKITVNAISPGPIATELLLRGKSEKQLGDLSKMEPLLRIGEVDDLQGAVAFLVSKDASWITGQIIRVNCGFA